MVSFSRYDIPGNWSFLAETLPKWNTQLVEVFKKCQITMLLKIV